MSAVMGRYIQFKWSGIRRAFTIRAPKTGCKVVIQSALMMKMFPNIRLGRDYLATVDEVTAASADLAAILAQSTHDTVQ